MAHNAVDARLTGTGDTFAESELQTLRENGGEIIHTFAAGRLVRVAIDVGRLLPLHKPGPFYSGDFLAHATTVINPASLKVRISVGLDRTPTDADVKAAENLGGRIVFRFTGSYVVEIDDARVPELRALPGVLRLSAEGYGCVA